MAIEMTKHDKECSWAQEQAALHVYGELPDEQRHRLEQHVRGCEECGAELAAYGELREQMQLAAVREPSANLLASARMRVPGARAAWVGCGRRRVRGAFTCVRCRRWRPCWLWWARGAAVLPDGKLRGMPRRGLTDN